MIRETILWFGRSALFPGLLLGLLAVQGVVPGQAGEPMLVVRNVAVSDAPEVRLTEEEILAMPQTTVRTETEFTDGVTEFSGPLARHVAALVGIEDATTVHFVAANDYSVDVPVKDIVDYDVILATHANGRRLSRRGKGPLWVMYPLSDHRELQDPDYNRRLIWQLTTMELQ